MCDFIVITHDGKAAFIDTKTTNDIRFPHSLIDQQQVKQLREVGDLCPAGYVVYFRPANKVVFFPWNQLEACRPKESIDMDHGLDLGPINYFHVKKIFPCNRQIVVSR